MTALAFSAALVLAALLQRGWRRSANDTGSATETTSGAQVTVTETEYALSLSRTALTPGT
ncbi:hypothetical protein BOG92_000860 [Streptomyces sp. WAC00263]|nr:hypothetical protein BOG92_000860 [Streptomyces sp. WAC00263]